MEKILISRAFGKVDICDIQCEYIRLHEKCQEYQEARGLLLDYSGVIFDFAAGEYHKIVRILDSGSSSIDHIAVVSNNPFNTAFSILVARSVKNVKVGIFSTLGGAEQWLNNSFS